MSFIGIDIGTSFIKGAILDLDKRDLRHIRRIPFPSQIGSSNPFFCEFDPNQIITVIQQLIRDLSSQTDCNGVVMCAQMHGLVLFNRYGQPVSNCITWRDRRALMAHPSGFGSYFDVLLRRISPEQKKQLGNELKPDRPISYLFWLSESGELHSDVMPVSIPDFVFSALCTSTPGVEITNAGAYGALDLTTSDWHHDVIKELGLNDLRWPVLRAYGDIVGHLQIQSKPVPCYTPVGDFQCALVGALFGPDELSLNMATGSQVSRLMLQRKLGAYQTRPFFDGKFINTFSDIPGGASLDVLIALLSEVSPAQVDRAGIWKFIERAVRSVEETDLSVDLTFSGATNEHGGRISNIGGGNLTVGHLFRASFNNMAEQYYARARELWPEKAWTTLVFSGGLASKLDPLRDVVTKRFGSKCRPSFSSEDALFGLLVLASVFTGRAKSVKALTEELRANYSAAV